VKLKKTAFVYDDALARHVLSEEHPLKAIRLRYTYELLESYGGFQAPNAEVVMPRPASEEEVLRFHTRAYLDAVKGISSGDRSVDGSAFGFGPGDNPAFEGMYEAAGLSAGASLRGAELVASGEADAALSISGGLHHAMPGRASGFCVFNDPVLAIMHLLERGMRVAYVDIDCHHGDGVQHAFYDTDSVLTISVHESGRFLFPGTGFTEETGSGKGRGYSVNLPLYPHTTDDVYLWAFRRVVPRLLEAFQPDVLVTQLGVDSHYRDPITHLALTVQGFGEAVTELSRSAPRWLALGGGGYDLQAVARAWTTAFGIMSAQQLPDEVPASYRDRYGVSTLSDTEEPQVPDGVRTEARAFAESSVLAVERLIFPTHGLGPG
jgi:acetoin utilization protein AcuC